MVENRLRESLTTGGRAEISRETEGFVDRQISLDVEQRGTRALLFSEDMATPPGESTVDTAHGLFRNLDLNQEDRLENGRVGKESRSVENTASSGDDLTTTTVDGISVKSDIKDVEADSAHRLLTNGTLTGSPLETRDNGVLDFVQVLNGLGLVNQKVGARGVGTETPDLSAISNIPSMFISEVTSTLLEIVTGSNLALLDIKADFLRKRLSREIETVVLVGRLGQSSYRGGGSDSLTVLDDGVGNTERDTSMVVLKILQANLQVQLTCTSDNVFTGFIDTGQHARVRLRETLETLDKLGKIVCVFDLNRTLNDRGDREFHDLHVVGTLTGSESTRLEQELVNTDQTQDVSGRNIFNGLDEATHHKNSTLDRLDKQIFLLSGSVVRALDANLDTRAASAREDATKSVETTTVRGWNHLRNVHHERSIPVTVADTKPAFIVRGALVQSLSTVFLSGDGRRQVENHHLQQGISSRQELAHDRLEEGLAVSLLLLIGKLNFKLVTNGEDFLSARVGDSVEDLEDRIEDKLVEGALDTVTTRFGPLFGLGVEEVLTLEIT